MEVHKTDEYTLVKSEAYKDSALKQSPPQTQSPVGEDKLCTRSISSRTTKSARPSQSQDRHRPRKKKARMFEASHHLTFHLAVYRVAI